MTLSATTGAFLLPWGARVPYFAFLTRQDHHNRITTTESSSRNSHNLSQLSGAYPRLKTSLGAKLIYPCPVGLLYFFNWDLELNFVLEQMLGHYWDATFRYSAIFMWGREHGHMNWDAHVLLGCPEYIVFAQFKRYICAGAWAWA